MTLTLEERTTVCRTFRLIASAADAAMQAAAVGADPADVLAAIAELADEAAANLEPVHPTPAAVAFWPDRRAGGAR